MRLHSEEQPLPDGRIAQFSSSGRDDYLAVDAAGHRPEQQRVNVVLHVMDGQVGELEVFDTAQGEGAAVPLSDLTDQDEPIVRAA
jgi:hypothetical protein